MLPPELIKVIAQLVKHATPQDGKLADEQGAREDQADLMRLMRASKAIKDQASPILLKDSFVVSPNGMSNKLKTTPAAFAQVKRLRFAYHEPSDSNLYSALLRSEYAGWIFLVTKSAPDGHEPSTTQLCSAGQTAAWGQLASQLLVLQRDGPTPLQSLERVVMGVGYSPLGSIYAMTNYEGFASQGHVNMNLATSLANSMLRVGARHYCQRESFGPLALPCVNILCVQAPATITYHLPGDFFGRNRNLDDQGPPIVLGTVNRYIFPRLRSESIGLSLADFEDVLNTAEMLAEPILNMLARTAVYRPAGNLALDENTFSSTTLYFYNYVDRFAALIMQRYFDAAHQPGQPTVYVRPLEQAGPCPACDLDPRKTDVCDV